MGTPTTDNDVDKEFFASQSETRTVVTERAISRQVDVLFRAVCDEVVLRKERVGLDLIGRLATRPAKRPERGDSEENIPGRHQWHQ